MRQHILNRHLYRLDTKSVEEFFISIQKICRSQWPRGLRRRSTAARLLIFWVRIPPGAWMSVCCECCVLSGRGLCDELITRPEESYRLWCVVMCDLETSRLRRPCPALGRSVTGKNNTGNVLIMCKDSHIHCYTWGLTENAIKWYDSVLRRLSLS